MSFRDVIGHREVLGELRASLAAGRLPHALLFAGKQGVGKALAATALAAARLCERGGDEACGACTSCRGFAHGNHPDFERIERAPGKRDIGIGQIRELLERLHRSSVSGRGRVALVDESERIGVEAQNAFLKTLEEPPPGAHIVLVAASPERLLPTVRSRCQIFRFGRLDDAEMAEFLRRRGGAPSRVPQALALGSPGTFERLADDAAVDARDATLDFLIDPSTSPFELAGRLVAGAASGGDDEDADARERTRDRLALALRLMSFGLRDLALISLGIASRVLNVDRATDLEAAAATRTPWDFLAGIDACEDAIADLRRNVDPALAIAEAALRVRGGEALQQPARS